MTKVAYNACFGGFGLSDTAYEMWLDRKGIAWEKRPGTAGLTHYCKKGHGGKKGSGLYHGGFHDLRSDPDLIAIIEKMGDAANGMCADLQIEEVAAGNQYRIDEYDGLESVMTRDDYEWNTAQ